MKKEQNFKFRCERLAKKITKKTDIIFTEIKYKEIVQSIYSDRRLSCSEVEFGRRNRIQVTFIGCGEGVQKFNLARKNCINRILKTNARYCKDSESQPHQIIITFYVNPHKM